MRIRRDAHNYLLWLTALLGAVVVGVSTVAAVSADRLPRFVSVFVMEPDRLDEMADRYDAVIWHNHPIERRALARLRERNADLTAFMYRELFCVLERETPNQESVGRYDWIDANHPDWFQLDAAGRRVEVPDYPGRWMMDLGHPGWQAFWIERTLRDVVDHGWDGVFADDALTTIRAHHLPPLAGYPDDATLQRDVHAFLARASRAFHEAGKLLVANVSGSYDYPGLWARWLEVTDGLMEEHFAGDGWTWGEEVAERQLEALRLAAKRDKWVFCLTYGSWRDRAKMADSYAAYLVGAGSKAFWSYRPSYPSDEPNPTRAVPDHSWMPALGRPIGPPAVSDGVWQRRFEHGVVAVNAGTATARITGAGTDPFRLRSLRTRVIVERGADADVAAAAGTSTGSSHGI